MDGQNQTTGAQTNPGTQTQAQNQQQAENTFTQAQLDAIIADRLSRERAKYADYETLKEKAGKFDAAQDAGKSEIEKLTERATAAEAKIAAFETEKKVASIRAAVAKEAGIPAELLTGDTEESCKAQAAAIAAYAKTQQAPAYPDVHDGGTKPGSTGGQTAAQQFADWFNANLH